MARSAKQDAVTKQVRRGMAISVAMRKVGYSETTINRGVSRSHSPLWWAEVQGAKKEWHGRFMRSLDKEGLTPEYAGRRLKAVTDERVGWKHANSIVSAIKLLTNVTREEQVNSVSNTNVGVFIIPEKLSNEEWNEKYKNFGNEGMGNVSKR